MARNWNWLRSLGVVPNTYKLIGGKAAHISCLVRVDLRTNVCAAPSRAAVERARALCCVADDMAAGFPNARRAFGGSYSQAREDWALFEQFSSYWNSSSHRGVFLEMGALDGWTHSNSLAYERWLNWTGVLIEANPDSCVELFERRRSGATVNLCTAISNGSSVAFERSGLREVFAAKDQMSAEYRKRWRRTSGKEVVVPGQPLGRLLRMVGLTHIDAAANERADARIAIGARVRQGAVALRGSNSAQEAPAAAAAERALCAARAVADRGAVLIVGARAAVDAAGELGAAEGWKSEEAGAEVAAGGGVIVARGWKHRCSLRRAPSGEKRDARNTHTQSSHGEGQDRAAFTRHVVQEAQELRQRTEASCEKGQDRAAGR